MSQIVDKPRRAVLISAVSGEDVVRVFLDDVINQVQVPKSWTQREHITNKEIPRASLESMTFDDKELADFGHYILARLSAFMKMGEL